MRIRRIEPGEPLRAERQNELIGVVNRLTESEPEFGRQLGLFRLTGTLYYPGGASSSSGEDEDQAPTVSARQLWLNHSSEDYTGTDDGVDVTLYHPLAIRDNGDYIGLPTLRIGQRVYAWWNPQAQRWELIEEYLNDSYWGQLDDQLSAGGTATVSIYTGIPLADTGINVLAYAPPVLVAGNIPDEDSSSSGEISQTWVRVKWFSDDGVWYVVSAEC